MFLALLLASNGVSFWRLPFFLSSWAHSFLLAALSIATIKMAALSGQPALKWLAEAMLLVLTVIVVWLAVCTLQAVLQSKVYVPEGSLSLHGMQADHVLKISWLELVCQAGYLTRGNCRPCYRLEYRQIPRANYPAANTSRRTDSSHCCRLASHSAAGRDGRNVFISRSMAFTVVH